MSNSRDPLVVGRVVGDILDPFTASVPICITYNGTVVTNGRSLKPSQVSLEPAVEIRDYSTAFYTLVMVDPDAPNPSEPVMREYLHWMVTNIPGGSDARSGQVVVRYESPEPTVGIHRMIFALFRQPGGRQIIDAPGWRQNFCTCDFAGAYEMGPPVAATFFNCQRELTASSNNRRRR